MYISENEVRAALTYEALIPAIHAALIDYSAGRVQQPARMIMRAGNAEGHRNGWFALMPVIHGDFMAVKTVTFYPGNADLGIATHMAIIELLDRATGEPLAVMDGRLITEMRTAAVSAAAFAALAPLYFDTPPETFGIIGSGVQARAHVHALRHVWPAMRDIRIWSPTRQNAEKCAAELSGRSVPIEAAASADVVLTATLSSQPVLHGRWLQPHALVLAVGGIGPTNRELDNELMRSCYLVAESRECVGRESGDVIGSGASIHAEIGEILARPDTASIPKTGRVLFKTVGMAIEDLTAARQVWEKQGPRDQGTEGPNPLLMPDP
jgi:ornithine cyclodeaminase/alanine dehydrogenase-like protein (mu-crystallin family)